MTAPTPTGSRRFDEPTFEELMAEQLRRAPWIAISIVAHAIALLLLALLVHERAPERVKIAVSVDPSARTDGEFADDATTDEPVVVEDAEAEPVVEDPLEKLAFEEAEEVFEPFQPLERVHPLGPAEMLERLRTSTKDGSALDSIGSGAESEEFRRRVRNLRRSGLDIVFCFDSTQSMDDVLDETKARIETMTDVLSELVANTRIGIVTYRDHGAFEDYVTRSIPLGDDRYRIVNFMHTVHAAGGGDLPEAVFDGLRVAVEQMRWRKSAHRVIVLIGDAPAKQDDRTRIHGLVRRFTNTADARLHAIMTKRDSFGIDEDCRASFAEIAEAGRGSCIPLEDEAVLLREVASLAFGRRFRKSLDTVYSFVNERRNTISARARDVVYRADRDGLRAAFFGRSLDDEVVRACAKSDRAEVAQYLIEHLPKRNTPERSRHALSFAVQRMLRLHGPPLDPETGDPVPKDRAEILHKLAARDLR